MDGEQREEQPQNSHRDPAAHLLEHRFKPGVSGNPKGRPPGREFNELVREFLDDDTINGKLIPGSRTKGMLLIEAIFKEALKGRLPHARFLIDRGYGPVAERREISGPEGGAIPVAFEVLEVTIAKIYPEGAET